MLDPLLGDPRIRIEGASGTSAGAMNAVVMAHGLRCGGENRAREALREFWAAVSRAGMASPIQRTPLDRWLGRWSLDYSPGYLMMEFLSRLVSPYQFNPFDFNPLRDIVAKQVDFEAVWACPDLKLFVTATDSGPPMRMKLIRNMKHNYDYLPAMVKVAAGSLNS